MTGEEAALAVIDALDGAAIPYMLVGSLASNFYGVPRATVDADFVIALEEQPVSSLVERLNPSLRFDPQMAFELITGTTRNVIEVKGSTFVVELFRLSDDAHDQERFRRRRRVQLFDHPVFLATVEDIIITKLRWFLHGQRSKDREDARNVIAVQGSRIDWEYVNQWCGKHGTQQLLQQIRSSIPAS